MKVYLVIISLLCFGSMYAYQFGESIIVSREERGAPALRTARVTSGDRGYVPPKKAVIAENFLWQAYPQFFRFDRIQRIVDNKRVYRPIRYNTQKRKIFVHHTGRPLSGSVQDTLLDIFKFHSYTRNRGDIGYNYIIAPDGTIYEGRYGGPDAIGAHINYNNTDSVGISLIGNFDDELVPQAQFDSLVGLTRSLIKKYDIDPIQKTLFFTADKKIPYIKAYADYPIQGHGDVAGGTACPGENLETMIPELYKKL